MNTQYLPSFIKDLKALKSTPYFESNGIVGQGNTPKNAMGKLKNAIESFQSVCEMETNIYSAHIS